MIYLNNAATCWPKAPCVAETVAMNLDDMPFHAGRSGFNTPARTINCRSLLAKALHITDSSRIIYCYNATHALNLALYGFPWKQGATVLTTAAEHNAVLRPLYYLRKHHDIKLEIVPVDSMGRVIPELWDAAVKKTSPQLAVFTHASNVTGAIQPVAELSNIAKQGGAATLLDASQTLGLIDVLPDLWSIDMVAFTGHKYLLGPAGTGGLYIANTIELEPVWVGGTGMLSELEDMPPELPARLEAGTPNDPALEGLAQALLWQKQQPPNLKAIDEKVEKLSLGLRDFGAKVVEVSSPRMPVISFVLPGWEVDEVGEVLYKSFDLICRTGLHCAPLIHKFLVTGENGNIRVSLSRFTSTEDIHYTLLAIRAILL